jgi:hypothetical protein
MSPGLKRFVRFAQVTERDSKLPKGIYLKESKSGLRAPPTCLSSNVRAGTPRLKKGLFDFEAAEILPDERKNIKTFPEVSVRVLLNFPPNSAPNLAIAKSPRTCGELSNDTSIQLIVSIISKIQKSH